LPQQFAAGVPVASQFAGWWQCHSDRYNLKYRFEAGGE
jgi:hypothetical protein